jgi:hypothetical protein
LGRKYKSSAIEIQRSWIWKDCERRPHVIEDAPSRIAPASSEDYKVELIGFKLNFKNQISITDMSLLQPIIAR